MVLIKPCKEAMVRCVEVGIYPAKNTPHTSYTLPVKSQKTLLIRHTHQKKCNTMYASMTSTLRIIYLCKNTNPAVTGGARGGGLKYHT